MFLILFEYLYRTGWMQTRRLFM